MSGGRGRTARQRVAARLGRSRAEEGHDLVEARVRRLMAATGVDVAVDVGANRGLYSQRLRSSLGFAGRIIALEPDPQMFTELSSRMAGDGAFTGLPVAAGAERGTAVLNRVVRAPGLNSLLAPSASGSARFDAFDTVEPVEVEVLPLDECVLPLIDRARSVLLKIDTQGFELPVLTGARQLLDRVSVLQLELPAIELYDGMADPAQLLDLVRASGFDLVDLVPGGRDREGLFLLDFDVVAARRRQEPPSPTRRTAGQAG